MKNNLSTKHLTLNANNGNITLENDFTNFVKEIKTKILSSQYEALKAVNKELINLY